MNDNTVFGGGGTFMPVSTFAMETDSMTYDPCSTNDTSWRLVA
jgi:hypothetical protein